MAPKRTKGGATPAPEASARELLELLDAGKELPRAALERLHRMGQPLCAPSCGAKGSKGARDNPECFCALLPAPGTFRRKGLWQKEPALASLGQDPATQARVVR